ncbi:DUF4241 domain-containing protein [Nonomuraea turcica]|uniref:DUF4241 domain-containing protein n=1 Tax=Nonomuraea sp. G32 TaxID=3067274 RepID=UPI0035300C37
MNQSVLRLLSDRRRHHQLRSIRSSGEERCGDFVRDPDDPVVPVCQRSDAELIDPRTGANIVFFDCGMGDGFCPTWIGRSANGEIACFATDLELLSHSSGPVAS